MAGERLTVLRASFTALATIAAAFAALATPAVAPAAPPSGPDSFGLLASNANFLPADHALAYQQLYAAGVRAVRLDVTWSSIERTPGSFDWSGPEAEITQARNAGLQVIGILCCGNPLYSTAGAAAARSPIGGLPPFSVGSASYFPPDDPATFASFAAAAASHFSGRVLGWEIWNEQNSGWRFWEPHEDAGAYGRLLCAAHDAIRAHDANVTVAFGGVFYPAVPTAATAPAAQAAPGASAADQSTPGAPSTSGPDFVRAAYAANPKLGSCYDAMAYHPYPYTFTAPELDVPIRGSVLAAADGMRAAMGSDRTKPLWITEVGWPTHSATYGVNEAKQAQYVARMAAATFAQGIPVLTFYTYGDAADPTGGANQEAWFGFFRPDGTPKPSYGALQTFTYTFAGTHFDADLSRALRLPAGSNSLGGRGFALRYAATDRTITAVWLANESVAEGQGPLPDGATATPGALAVEVPVRSPSATVISIQGARTTVLAHAGTVRVLAGASPQYVLDAAPPAP